MGDKNPCSNEDTSPHGWTLDTLEEHLSAKIRSLAELTAMENRASKEAVGAALQPSRSSMMRQWSRQPRQSTRPTRQQKSVSTA